MMKYKFYKRNNTGLTLCILGALFFSVSVMTGCTKWDKLTSPNEGQVYMARAYSTRSELQVFKISTPQSFTFGASMAGFDGATTNTVVQFEVDNSLLAAFNQKNAYLGYHFVALPEKAYNIPKMETTIEKGRSDSDPLSFTISADKLDATVDYCLPIKIKSVSKGSIDTTLSVSYFMIDSLYIRSRDVTAGGTLTVSNENTGGPDAKEGSVRLTDNDYTTKYLFFDFVPNSWMQLKFDSSFVLNAYTLTSGNDASGRDPKDWELQGSNDGNQWVTLDKRTDFFFTNRRQTVTFEFNHPDGKAYSYYRFLILDNNGDDLFQMTEWRLLQYY